MCSYISIKTMFVMITKFMFNMITKFMVNMNTKFMVNMITKCMVNMITKFMFNMIPVGDHVGHRSVQRRCVGLAGGVGRPRNLGGDSDDEAGDGGDGDDDVYGDG